MIPHKEYKSRKDEIVYEKLWIGYFFIIGEFVQNKENTIDLLSGLKDSKLLQILEEAL